MNADRWKQVEDCYHSAMERPAAERPAFLAQACANDPELRREVESLLALGPADEILASPLWDHISSADDTATIAPGALSAGSMMADYRIAGKLGSGGMGEVYRATDTKLHRDVAIKVLAPRFAQDSAWISRFQREARVLAALNHPHIAAIYGLEESGGVRAIAMELVEGPTLAERMARGRIASPEALAIARQIAEALEYAHEKRIVHRDLKPANVKLRPDGVIKVLDFGLAKAIETKEAPAETATHAGVIMGTPAYMAPEQVAGLPVDRRADVWAFGVVLFEMLAGRKIYSRKTTLETLAAVAKDEPPWDELPTETPASVLWLLRRCLDRDAKNRLRDIGEARIAIDTVYASGNPLSDPVPADSHRARAIRWTVAAALCLVAGAGAGYIWPHRSTLELRSAQFTVDAPGRSIFVDVFGGTAVSPDGRFLVFSARDNGAKSAVLWLRPIDSLGAHPLSGTEGGQFPFWSPDSQSLAFFADDKLKRMTITGGAPVTLCEVKVPAPAGGAWNQDGLILFAGEDGLYRVPASGGVAARITQVDAERHETGHGYPQFLPDRRRFLYYVQSPDPNVQGVYGAALDRPRERSRILSTDHKALYSAPRGSHPGLLLWLREQALLAQPFDIGKLKLEGEPARLADNISIENTRSNSGAPSRAAFWLSEEGVLAYHADAAVKRKMLWMGRDGKPIQEAAEEDEYSSVRLSPDGKRAIVGRIEASDRKNDLWLLDLGRGVMTRLTADGRETGFAVWSPDGRTVAYSSERKGVVTIYRKDVGAQQEEQLTNGTDPSYVTSWSRDGRYLFCTRPREKNGTTIWALPVDEGGSGSAAPKLFPVVQIDSYGGSAAFSPDGKWMAYHSAESGRTEIYARPFAGASSGKTGRWQVSRQGGMSPKWRGDGGELYYLSPEGTITAATVRTASGNFESDAPHDLFRITAGYDRGWDASADGQRFLVLGAVTADTVNASPLTVVLNWQAGLKK